MNKHLRMHNETNVLFMSVYTQSRRDNVQYISNTTFSPNQLMTEDFDIIYFVLKTVTAIQCRIDRIFYTIFSSN